MNEIEKANKNDMINEAIDNFTDLQCSVLYDLAHDSKLKNEFPYIHSQIITLYKVVTGRTEKLIHQLKEKLEDE